MKIKVIKTEVKLGELTYSDNSKVKCYTLYIYFNLVLD